MKDRVIFSLICVIMAHIMNLNFLAGRIVSGYLSGGMFFLLLMYVVGEWANEIKGDLKDVGKGKVNE